MRELERETTIDTNSPTSASTEGSAAPRALGRIAIVGRGRLGSALAAALGRVGADVVGPLGHDESVEAEAALLCVPDAAIAHAARSAAAWAPLIGHTSGATPLAMIAESTGADCFGLHPLQTFAGDDADADRFRGCAAAIAGTSAAALEFAEGLARRLDMDPIRIDERHRAGYHAAASIASNFLIVLEDAAETVAERAGLDRAAARAALAPLVRASVENWAELGPERALTGPVARGDEATIAAQRSAIERSAPELLELFDSLLERGRSLAARATPLGRAA
ncbi:MAG: DUF2520 domain-containing protein [Thermoleophilaceae bacterium]|nr:DUF2520 domain-containing protein [Thermoleophilaceae bacterium]